MAINALIPMQGADINKPATSFQQGKQNKLMNALNQEQIQGQQVKNRLFGMEADDTQKKMQIQRGLTALNDIEPMLMQGDTQGVQTYLQGLVEAGELSERGFQRIQPVLQNPQAFGQLKESLINNARVMGIMEAPQQPKPTPLMQEAQMLFPDNPQKQQEFVQKARQRSGVSVEVNQGGLATEKGTEKFGEGVGERANERIVRAQEGARQNAQLDIMEAALATGADTGLGEGVLLDLRNLANTAFGLELPENASEQEVIRSLQSQMALRIRSPESGMGLPGATSNRDIKFLMDIVPGLTRSRGGNLKLIDAYRRLNNLSREVAKEQSRIIRENGGRVPFDLDEQLADFVENQDILTEEERESMREAANAEQPRVIDFSELPD